MRGESVSDPAELPTAPLTGARRDTDGRLDFSRAAVVHFPNQSQQSSAADETEPEQAQKPMDRCEATQKRLEDVCSEALAAGVNEAELKSWVNMARSNGRPDYRRSTFRTVTRGRDASLEQAQNLALCYDKETTRANMPSPVFHYHQTGAVGFKSIVAHSAVLSNQEQLAMGIITERLGSSRPDVVQFTRDSINKGGRLTPGISMGVDIGKGGSVTLIFNESVMDDPNYDGIAQYPSVPRASLDNLAAAAVGSPADIADAEATLAAAGRQDVPVVLRQDWINQYN